MDFNAIAKKWQTRWEKEKIFEVEPSKKEKFFITVPYPYISGSLHIGHARVVIEADVYSRFLRMQGKNVLFPMAFHISGTPVLGISLAIKNGDQEKIDLYKSYVRSYIKNEKEVEETVKSFTEPWNIVNFFIPKMMGEYALLGLGVDWRRSFTSGDPIHQQLVTWQFQKYKEKKYIMQGKYPVLYSLGLKNAVGEDDISGGDTEPVEKQEFTLIKFKYKDAFLVAATLRQDTLFGVTNIWINPNVIYVLAKVNNESWIISKEAGEKLGYQDKTIKIEREVPARELLGKSCIVPLIDKEVIILPLTVADPDMGTGIVMGVPSDAPIDYIALKELQENKKKGEEYGLPFEKIKGIKPIEIINMEGYGPYPAKDICEKSKITSLQQIAKLKEVTQELYKSSFYKGKMTKIYGDLAGQPVSIVKESIKSTLIKKKLGDIFYETSRPACSRDGGKVIVAIFDNQWFLDFNASGWKAQSKKELDKTVIVPEKYRKQFEDTFVWLDKRPCARLRGLGTQLPFDKQWVIESLSDSTLYMTLYPIAHHIKEWKIQAEQLDYDFFEYVLLGKGAGKDIAKKTKLTEKQLNTLREEFDYWYPFDQRHTFSVHLANHLSFMIFAHNAVFQEKKWPKKITLHGMVLSEGEKMSKSKGNVVTLLDIVTKYNADTLRSFICYSTNVGSDFNWESGTAIKISNHLNMIYETIKEMTIKKGDVENKYILSKVESAMLEATKYLENMDLRNYARVVLYEIYHLYKKMKGRVKEEEMSNINYYLAERWIPLLSPLVPHLAEELWERTGHKGFVCQQEWPKYDEKKINPKIDAAEEIKENTTTDIQAVLNLIKIKPKEITLFISEKWKYPLFKKLRQEENRDFGVLMKKFADKEKGQDIAKLVQQFMKGALKTDIVLSPEEEMEALKEQKISWEKQFEAKVHIIHADASKEQKAKQAIPGKVAILIK